MILHFLFIIPTFYTLTQLLPFFLREKRNKSPSPPCPPTRLDVSFRIHIRIYHLYDSSFVFCLDLSSRGFPIGWEFGGAYPPPELSRCGCILRFCADPVLTVSMFFTGGCLLCMNWRSTGPPVKRNSCTKTASLFFSASNGIKRGSF